LAAIVSNDWRYPDRPFGDNGGAIERMLAARIRDLFLAVRYAVCNAVLARFARAAIPASMTTSTLGNSVKTSGG
jgi:hypothetical protein